MNIAFPAIIVFVLLFPGFVARSQFKRAERALLDYSPFGQVVAQAVAWACLLHLVWLASANYLLGQRLDTGLLLGLLASGAEQQSAAIHALAARDTWLAIYFASMLAFVYLAPAMARAAISHWRLDRSSSPLAFIFRFTKAPWYYLLTGADFDAADEPDLVYVAAIVDAAGTATLYTGIVEDFFFDESGGLDRLVLSNVSRRALATDKPRQGAATAEVPDDSADRFYPVDGDYFVLRYSEIITLNVRYLKLEDADPIDANGSEPP